MGVSDQQATTAIQELRELQLDMIAAGCPGEKSTIQAIDTLLAEVERLRDELKQTNIALFQARSERR